MSRSHRPDDETLFFSNYRWLYNEDLHRKVRTTPFDVEALENIACHAVGARRCISWSVLGEGGFNKVFLLTFDNDATAVVRLPSRAFGNVQLATASEVATMCYVRERYQPESTDTDRSLPPRVLAWSASHQNPAGTPYIILEYVPGVPLGARWYSLDFQGDDVGVAIVDLASFEWGLLHEPLSQNGAIYFATDVSEELRNRPLYPEPPSDDLRKRLSEKYRIGPTVDREWWRGDYARVDANRGPWPDMQTMIKSAAEFQLRAIDTVVDFSSPLVTSNSSDVPLLRRMLEICIRIAPLVVPNDPALTTPVLNHLDRSLANIIVEPEGHAYIRGVIDWQGTTVSPFFMQCGLPSAIRYEDDVITIPEDGSLPPWPEYFDQLSPEEQDVVRIHHRRACRHRLYNTAVVATDIPRLIALNQPHLSAVVNLPLMINRCAADGPRELRDLLIRIQLFWHEFSDSPCPIDFTLDEMAAHAKEAKDYKVWDAARERLLSEIRCRIDGAVHADRFEEAKEIMEKCRKEWNESEMKGPFPFYEGAHSYVLT
ncbi:hypothetical protein K474DRAFT_1670237 [Panus rudis PR-1116 ss-1]|nr:hypothetical protein K474DRAFT_1670237 [Panus rudis PR-1116 ss-1]